MQKQVLYYDTDSVIYKWRDGQTEIETGDFLGEMTDELDGDTIEEFGCIPEVLGAHVPVKGVLTQGQRLHPQRARQRGTQLPDHEREHQLKVLSSQHPFFLIYRGPDADKKIILLKSDTHYEGCDRPVPQVGEDTATWA